MSSGEKAMGDAKPGKPEEGAKAQRYGSSTPHDVQIWERLERAAAKSAVALSDVLESFPVYVRRVNLTRFLAHCELYRRIAELPGSIIEVGVYRGVGLFTWAKLLEIFHAGDRTRRVIGFDNFAGFTSFDDKDGPQYPNRGKVLGGWSAAQYREELLEHIDIFHEDSFVPRAKRIQLVEGDVVTTAPKFALENPGLRVSLLHLDIDLYEPTLAALKAFYPLVVKGGLVVFDEYGLPEWAGESRAVEEYFAGAMPRIEKFSFASLPGGFFVKA
jgi:hypothetical protein